MRCVRAGASTRRIEAEFEACTGPPETMVRLLRWAAILVVVRYCKRRSHYGEQEMSGCSHAARDPSYCTPLGDCFLDLCGPLLGSHFGAATLLARLGTNEMRAKERARSASPLFFRNDSKR